MKKGRSNLKPLFLIFFICLFFYLFTFSLTASVQAICSVDKYNNCVGTCTCGFTGSCSCKYISGTCQADYALCTCNSAGNTCANAGNTYTIGGCGYSGNCPAADKFECTYTKDCTNAPTYCGYTGCGCKPYPECSSPTNPPSQPTLTPVPNCLCSSGVCTSSCVFNKFTSGVNYSSQIKCSLASDVLQSVPTSAQLNGWCKTSLRTKGDADASGVIDMTDYFYYVSAVNGGKIPASVNSDFDGDGLISTVDRSILMMSLKP